MADPISLTPNAIERIKNMQKENNNKLRIFVTGGGCAGFNYGFAFDDDTAEDDTVIQNSIVIDPLSYQYLVGSVIDYTEDIMGSKFVINNPAAVTTCGCGESFSM